MASNMAGDMALSLWSGLFGASFLAATVVPFSSEIAVAGALAAGAAPAGILVAATAGNTAGAAINWLLGRGIERFRERGWFPVGPRELERAQRWFQRYGVWSLLLAWVPLVGDGLTVVAGVMRVRLDVFVVLTAMGKGARYAALIAALSQGLPA